MATMFATAFAALSGGGAAAGAAGAAAAAGAGAATGGFSLLQGIQVASTVVGGLAAIFGGMQKQAALEAQAADEDIKASQELLNGRQEAVKAMKVLNAEMAQSVVASYASGLAPSGSVINAQEAALEIGDRNVSSARETGAMVAAGRRSQSAQLRAEGRAAMTGGIFSAISGGLQSIGRDWNRG